MITARYFVTCLTCPSTFDLKDEEIVQKDFNLDSNAGGFGGMGGMGGFNEDMMMAFVMNDGGMNPGLMNAEKLESGQQFTFSYMQNQLWEAAKKTHLVHHREFMSSIIQEL